MYYAWLATPMEIIFQADAYESLIDLHRAKNNYL